jgi:hypothetical protein
MPSRLCGEMLPAKVERLLHDQELDVCQHLGCVGFWAHKRRSCLFETWFRDNAVRDHDRMLCFSRDTVNVAASFRLNRRRGRDCAMDRVFFPGFRSERLRRWALLCSAVTTTCRRSRGMSSAPKD